MSKYSIPVSHKKKSYTDQPAYQRDEIDLDKLRAYWSRVDVIAQIEFHTSTRPFPDGNTWRGRCPFPDCSSQHDGLTIWPNLSKRGMHYHCRKCGKTGRLDTMLKILHPEWLASELLSNIGLTDDANKLDEAALARMSESHRKEIERQKWFKYELELLTGMYPSARQAIESYERPIAYNASRGVSVEQAKVYGLGYIPHTKELKVVDITALKNEPIFVRKWEGRIIFPLSAPDGQMTFAGRTVALWKPGMSPEEHKKTIEVYNAQFPDRDKRRIQRVVKTSPCGWFGYDLSRQCEEIAFVEGEYDALSLLICGIPAIAIARNFKASLVPLSIQSAVLALDNDAAGQGSNVELAQEMEHYGLTTRQVRPTGKDWNDMLIAGQSEEIVSLFKVADPVDAQHLATPTVPTDCHEKPTVENDLPEDEAAMVQCEECKIPDDGEIDWRYTDSGKFLCPACFVEAIRQEALRDPVYLEIIRNSTTPQPASPKVIMDHELPAFLPAFKARVLEETRTRIQADECERVSPEVLAMLQSGEQTLTDQDVQGALEAYEEYGRMRPQEREALLSLTRNADGIGFSEWQAIYHKCTTVTRYGEHASRPMIPPELDADSCKSSPTSKITKWERYCLKLGELKVGKDASFSRKLQYGEVIAKQEREAFLSGHTDENENWWCSICWAKMQEEGIA